MKSKFAWLAGFTVLLAVNIAINASYYAIEENWLWLEAMRFEPLVWLALIGAVAIRQRKKQKIFTTWKLILTGLIPFLWIITIILFTAQVEIIPIYEIMMLLLHPLSYMLVQSIAVTLLWLDIILREKSPT